MEIRNGYIYKTPDGQYVVCLEDLGPQGFSWTFNSELEAKLALDLARAAFERGQNSVRNEIKKALGLRVV